MPTVKSPFSRANWAITGAAPVPVPPPIPAVMKTISVSSVNSLLSSSLLSMAASRPTSGSVPAPNPWFPSFIFVLTELEAKACESVLQIIKSAPLMCNLSM